MIDYQGLDGRTNAPELEGRKLSDEQKVVQSMYRQLKLSKQRRDSELKREDTWKECWKFYVGDTWTEYPAWVPWVGANFCEALVDTNTAVLTAQRPQYSTRPLSSDGEFVCGIMDDTMHYLWDKWNYLIPIRMCVTGAGIYGVSYIKARWDVRRDDVLWDYVGPGNLYTDPLAAKIEDCRYVVQVTLQPRDEIERQYDINLADSDVVPYVQGSDWGNNNASVKSDYVRVFEYWYAFGRKRAVVCGQDLLEWDDNPIGMLPYARYVDKEVDNLMCPPGIIESVKRVQREYNEIRAQEHAIGKQVAWPKARVSSPELVKGMRSNRPNSVIVAEPGDVEWLTTPSPGNYLVGRPAILVQEMELVTGITDVAQGRRPPNIRSGTALTQLTESSHTRINSKVPALEACIARLGEITLRYIILNYTDERILPFMDTQKLQELAMYLQPDEYGQPESLMSLIKRTPLLIRIQAASTLSRSEGAMAQMMLQLYLNKVVDGQAVLEALKIPNWKAIMARMMAMGAFGQIAMGAGQPGSVPGGGATPQPNAPQGNQRVKDYGSMSDDDLRNELSRLQQRGAPSAAR